MDSEIKRLQQRIFLLRTHLQELKQHFFVQKEARQKLKIEHQKQLSSVKKDTNLHVNLITEHVRQVTELSLNFTDKFIIILARHRQEESNQNERINLERENEK